MFGLTAIQARVLKFIKRHITEKGYPPTRAEIARHFKWSSANAAQQHLEALQKKGALKINPAVSRGLVPNYTTA